MVPYLASALGAVAYHMGEEVQDIDSSADDDHVELTASMVEVDLVDNKEDAS